MMITLRFKAAFAATLALFVLTTGAGAHADTFVVKSPSRHVAYTYSPGPAGAPTVLVLNGLVYMLSQYQNFTAEMNRRGYSVIEMAYSTQPESVATLGGVKPAYLDDSQRPSLEDYADEAQSVLSALGVRTPLTIMGLSYGGSVAMTFARLWPNEVRQVILVSPLAVAGDNFALQQSILDSYLTYLNLFPVYGAVWANQTKENITQYYTSTLVSDPKTHFYPGVSKSNIQQGLVAMIRAAEDFKILNVDFTLVPPVHFILAGEEVPLRLQNQVDGFHKMTRQNRPGSLTIIKGAQHASTTSSPIDVANAVDRAVRSGAPGIFAVDPANHVPVQLDPAQQDSLFREIKRQSTQPQSNGTSTTGTSFPTTF